ncbi:GNAT family N-acetyltransferase [Boudabousia marimammalium]|uniref:N-acetyltransferase domain-containing protein n=1 Tax=Boudabousia marimammalium TaxID=156892 RepID=A0A1Q5PNW7_9ACTO|nr:GNAT family N-acetyltransferase [Boudabousia marimammalium]OKL49271.1 hypothetical protein BM477_04610 [Boudabousia marimammalium]
MTHSHKDAARLAKAEDAGIIGQLLAADMRTRITLAAPDYAKQLVPMIDEKLLAESWLEAITSRDGETVLVATADNEIVGFAAYMQVPETGEDGGKTAEILSFTIAENHRRQGHGSRLLQAVVDHAKLGSDELRVWISPNDEARVRFYDSAGFGATPAKRTLNLGPVKDPENLWVTRIKADGED